MSKFGLLFRFRLFAALCIATPVALGAASPAASAQPAPSPAAAAAHQGTTAKPNPIDTVALRTHTYHLAHDSLEGRGTGTRGERMAARYIESQLRRLGVPGASPDGGYRQPIPLRRKEPDTAATRLTVARDDARTVFATPRHFVLERGGAAALGGFAAEGLFAGTAGLAAEALAGAGDLHDRAIVIIGGLGADAALLLDDWTRRGAVGVVLLLLEPGQFEPLAESRMQPRFFVEADVDEPVWQPAIPILAAGPELGRALLAGAPLASDALDGTRPFHALPLQRRIEYAPTFRIEAVETANVAGLLAGADPALRNEVVVFTAHYDHLGIGAPDATGDSIYNGFSDNAAGVAMVLAIAQAMVRDPPARSVLFLFPSAEEVGLLGSTYYAAEPLVPLDRTVAVINLDGGAPPAPPLNWWLAGGDRSTLGELGARVGDRFGWEVRPTRATPSSDHWPLLRRGVPAVFLVPGQEWEGVDARQRERLHQRWSRYHQPGDRWHPDFSFRGLERYARLALEIGRAAADAPRRPRLVPTQNGAGPS